MNKMIKTLVLGTTLGFAMPAFAEEPAKDAPAGDKAEKKAKKGKKGKKAEKGEGADKAEKPADKAEEKK
jgi:hypothetical protein